MSTHNTESAAVIRAAREQNSGWYQGAEEVENLYADPSLGDVVDLVMFVYEDGESGTFSIEARLQRMFTLSSPDGSPKYMLSVDAQMKTPPFQTSLFGKYEKRGVYDSIKEAFKKSFEIGYNVGQTAERYSK